MPNGFYLINKPVGITSHDVIDRLRKITGERTIGHAGTLDPAASGLLIIAVGREYTKRISEYSGLNKGYIAEIELGKTSTTYDSEGDIEDCADYTPTDTEVKNALGNFEGGYMQKPPVYSAKKIKGRKAYELARKGKEVELQPVKVKIIDLEVQYFEHPILRIRTTVSAGTYIRSLAHDIGQKLGTGAYLKSLIRTKIGDFALDKAINLSDVHNPDDLLAAKIV